MHQALLLAYTCEKKSAPPWTVENARFQTGRWSHACAGRSFFGAAPRAFPDYRWKREKRIWIDCAFTCAAICLVSVSAGWETRSPLPMASPDTTQLVTQLAAQLLVQEAPQLAPQVPAQLFSQLRPQLPPQLPAQLAAQLPPQEAPQLAPQTSRSDMLGLNETPAARSWGSMRVMAVFSSGVRYSRSRMVRSVSNTNP